jgi:hypothetical protein
METKNMSANPHSVVHARQFADVEKSKDEQPRKAEPGVKGVVSGSEGKIGPMWVFSSGHRPDLCVACGLYYDLVVAIDRF